VNRKKSGVQLGQWPSAIRRIDTHQLWTTRRCGWADRAQSQPAASAERITAAIGRFRLKAALHLSRADLLSIDRHRQQDSIRSRGDRAASGSRPRSPAAAVVPAAGGLWRRCSVAAVPWQKGANEGQRCCRGAVFWRAGAAATGAASAAVLPMPACSEPEPCCDRTVWQPRPGGGKRSCRRLRQGSPVNLRTLRPPCHRIRTAQAAPDPVGEERKPPRQRCIRLVWASCGSASGCSWLKLPSLCITQAPVSCR